LFSTPVSFTHFVRECSHSFHLFRLLTSFVVQRTVELVRASLFLMEYHHSFWTYFSRC